MIALDCLSFVAHTCIKVMISSETYRSSSVLNKLNFVFDKEARIAPYKLIKKFQTVYNGWFSVHFLEALYMAFSFAFKAMNFQELFGEHTSVFSKK